MKWMTSFSALAFAGLMTSAVACVTPISDRDYAAMSTSELEDACAAAMAQTREAEPGRDSVVTPGEEDSAEGNGAMAACIALQERREAEGN